jgi:prepilin-type N-terminal cleavage/methylation domain-containing protein
MTNIYIHNLYLPNFLKIDYNISDIVQPRKVGGFTLLEVLLVLIVLGMLSAISFGVINSSLRIYKDQEGFILRHQQAQLATEYMIDDLKQSKNIITGNNWVEFDGYYKKNEPKRMEYRLYYSGDKKALGLKISSTFAIIDNVENIEFVKDNNLIKINLAYLDRSGRIRSLYTVVRPGIVD